MTRERDTVSCREASLSLARLALVIPGGLAFFHLFGAALEAGDELGRALPAWARVATAFVLVLGIGAWMRAVSREEAARG